MTTNHIEVNKAIAIFRTHFKDAKGKFKARSSAENKNEVNIFAEDGLYCTINVKTGKIKNI